MFSHIMVGSDDIDKSKKFYDAVLGVLGAGKPVRDEKEGIVRLFYFHSGSIFAVSNPIDGCPATVGNGSTIGLACDSLEQVKALHDAAVKNGGTSIEDPPGPRTGGMGTLNLCYFRDPAGNKICGLHRDN